MCSLQVLEGLKGCGIDAIETAGLYGHAFEHLQGRLDAGKPSSIHPGTLEVEFLESSGILPRLHCTLEDSIAELKLSQGCQTAMSTKRLL